VKGVEKMKKSTWIFLIGFIFLALTLNAMGQTGAVTLGAEEGTTSYQALKAGYVNSSGDGTVWTGMVISNSLGAPEVDGMPTGGDEEGTVTVTCFKSDTGEMVSAETPVVGPGESLILTFREVFGNTTPWAGYCYVVGNFDALSGLVIVGYEQAWYGYQMTEDFDGAPVGPVM